MTLKVENYAEVLPLVKTGEVEMSPIERSRNTPIYKQKLLPFCMQRSLTLASVAMVTCRYVERNVFL